MSFLKTRALLSLAALLILCQSALGEFIHVYNKLLPVITRSVLVYDFEDVRLPDGSFATLRGELTVTGQVANSWYGGYIVKTESGPAFKVLLYATGADYDMSVRVLPTEQVYRLVSMHRTDINEPAGFNPQITQLGREAIYEPDVEMKLGLVVNDMWHSLPLIANAAQHPNYGDAPLVPIDQAVRLVARPEVKIVASEANEFAGGLGQLSFGRKPTGGVGRFWSICKGYAGSQDGPNPGQDGITHVCSRLPIEHERWDYFIHFRGPDNSIADLMFSGWVAGPPIAAPPLPLVTASTGLLRVPPAGGAAQNLANRKFGAAAADSVFFDGGAGFAVAGRWLEFEYASPVRLIEGRLHQIVSGDGTFKSLGTWKYQAWNGSAWIDLTSAFALGGIPVQIHDVSTNTNSYTRYRLLGVSGTTTGNPWLSELTLWVE